MEDCSYKAKWLGSSSSSSDDDEQWVDDLDEMEEACYWVHGAQSSGNRRRGGSVPSHIVIERDHAAGHARIMADYFVPNPVYTDYQFRRR